MITENDPREQWIVKNRTNRRITLGDLPRSPTFQPKQALNILQYCTKDAVNQSKALISAVNAGLMYLNKQVDDVDDIIPTSDISDSITSAEENELIYRISKNEIITDDTTGVLAFGEDPDGAAKPFQLTGPEGSQLRVMSLDTEIILNDILRELIKANIQMSVITGDEIKDKEISID